MYIPGKNFLPKFRFRSHFGLTHCKALAGIDNNWPSNLSIATTVSWVMALLYKTSFCLTNYHLLCWGVRSYASLCQMSSISAGCKKAAVNTPVSNKHLTVALSKNLIFANYLPLQWIGDNFEHAIICDSKVFSLHFPRFIVKLNSVPNLHFFKEFLKHNYFPG